MSVLRIVRDRTRPDEPTFEVIERSGLVVTLVIREGTALEAPGLRWSVELVPGFPRHAATITGVGDSVERAFRDARRQLRLARPRGGLPSFTDDEWRAIEGYLRADGIFG